MVNALCCACCHGVGFLGIVVDRDGGLEEVNSLRCAPCHGVGFPSVVDRGGKMELEVRRGRGEGATRSTVYAAVRAWNISRWVKISLARIFHHERVLLLLVPWLLILLLFLAR